MPLLFFSEQFSIVITTTQILGLFIRTSGLEFPLESSNKRNPEVCKSKECMAMNENLRSKVDFSKDPCKDFYSFACGKYTEMNAKTELDKSVMKVTEHLIKIAKEPFKQNDHRALKMAREMYRYCFQHKSNIEDLKKIINHIGGWSLLDPNWKEKDFSLIKFFSKSLEIGYHSKSLFAIDIDINPESGQNIIAIRPTTKSNSGLVKRISRFPWPLDSIMSMAELNNYFQNKFIPTLVEKMKIDKIKLRNEIEEHDRIARIVIQAYNMPKVSKRIRLGEVQATLDNIPWMAILDGIFKRFKIKISSDDFIHISCPKCLKSLNDQIYNISMKSWASYLQTSFLFDTIIDADDTIMTQWLQLHGRIKKEDYCANRIFSLFRRVIDHEYYIQTNDEKLISIVKDFTEKQRTAMINIISISKVMDNESRAKAIDKVKKMVIKIGYDDEISTGKNLSLKYFDQLNVNPDLKSYFPSLFNVMKYTTEKLFETLGKPAKLPYLSATARNAAYYAYQNTLFLSINILSGVWYSKEYRPQYLNFGALGTIVAHEMNHAFDTTGRQIDNYGRFGKWWSPQTIRTHWERIECIINQYSDFVNVATGNKVNGYQTLSENYADIGGFEVAYKAYHEFLKNGDLLLPSFPNSTSNQMFWIAFAAQWCANPSKEDVLQLEKSDVHAINRIRVNGVAMNSDEFSTDWNCKKSTIMNPIRKCKVWK